MSAFMVAFKALIACSTMLRNGLCGGSFLSSELGREIEGLLWAGAPRVHLGRDLALPVPENH